MKKDNFIVLAISISFIVQIIVAYLFIESNMRLSINNEVEKFFKIDDYHLINPNNISFTNKDELLKYKDVVVLATYNTYDLAIYDYNGMFLARSSKYWGDNRYFSINDYKNSIDVRVKISKGENCDLGDKEILCVFDVDNLPSENKYPLIYNLFFKGENIKDLYINGNDKKEVLNIFLKNGFILKENKHFEIIPSILNSIGDIRTLFLVIVCALNILSIFIMMFVYNNLSYDKNKIEYLLGKSYKHLIKLNIIPFIIKVSLIVFIISCVTMILRLNFKFIFLDNMNLLNLSLFYILYTGLSYSLIEVIGYIKIEKVAR